TVIAQNSGTISPAPQNVTLDGTLRQFVVLRDAIPANTSFLGLDSAQTGATRLFHRAGDAPDAYLSLPPAATASIDAVALGLPSLAPNALASLVFRVRVGAVASTSISNVARFQSLDAGNSLVEVPSNEVVVALPQALPTLNYYTGPTYANLAGVTSMGRPLFLQGAAAASNRDASVVETVLLTVTSRLTGDSITVNAVETGPNTGIFRVQNPIPTSNGAADPANNSLEIRPNDQLDAVLQESGGARATADILVDPFGIVFDSRSNAPIAGARVTLIDVTGSGNGGQLGGPARVFDVDGVTVISSTVTTGADGLFRFPLVAGSTYRLDVVAPAGFSFPSRVSVFLLPASRRIDTPGSFGGNFLVSEGTGAVQIDVPLDPPPPSGLFLQKTASRRTADIADFVDYELRLRNTTGALLSAVSVADTLPRGFSLVRNSVRQGGASLADPIGAPGPILRFTVGDIAPDAELRLSYRVRIGAGVSSGDQVNRAVATGTTPVGNVTSNTAAAPVRVNAGVLTERSILFGKVFVDSNRNRIEDGSEPGVPGVRVWVEDGTYAVTDSEGKYSLYGLEARTHVVKVDRVTLPAGSQLAPLTVRHGGRGDSAFADLLKGELHKTNFALVDATPAILAQIEKRRAAGDPFSAEINPTLQGDLRRTVDDVAPDPRALPSTGTMSASGPVGSALDTPGSSPLNGAGSRAGSGFNTLNPGAINNLNTSQNGNNAGTFSAAGNVFVPNSRLNENNSNLSRPTDLLPRDPQSNAPRLPDTSPKTATIEGGTAGFEAALQGLDNSFAVLSPREGEALPLDQANIRIKGSAGAKFSLRVNGAEVPETRVGARLTDPARALQAWEYVGVRFKAGQNLIEASQLDAFGNVRGTVQLRVLAPGRAGRILIDAPSGGLPADGVSPVPITIRVVDDKGLPITSRTPLTLETASGRFDLPDLNEREPGLQLFVEGGSVKVDLLPPAEPGDGLIRALSGLIEARRKLSFVPELRPLIALGTLEGGVNFFNFRPQGVSGDLLQDDLGGLLRQSNGQTQASARAALFLKGRVLGKNLLTLRYDSQTTRDRLFRDIQPDEFYPVYGDGALKGFDAQSTGKLYIRLDRERNSFLIGDFSTASATQFNTLGNYQRALNGARQHLETGAYKLDLFAARDSGTQIVDEIRANGTSGGYLLRSGNLIQNSERVEIIVRDRNNPGVILEVRPQTRFRDYEFDFATGRILFRAPVPTFDPNFDPIFVRVFYQVDNGGPKFWVQGLNGAVKITPNLEIGGSLVRDENPLDNFNLKTLTANYQLGQNTSISGELAQTSRDSIGNGQGSRLEVLHQSARLQARFFAGRTSADFDNPGSILSRGRGEINLRAAWRLNAKTRFLTEALRTTVTSTGNQRTGLQAAFEREIGRNRLEIGLRRAKENAPSSLGSVGATPIDFTSIRTRLTVPVGEKTNAFGEYEFDLSDSSRRVLALGGDHRLSDRSRIYARHEFISALDGRYALNGAQEQQNTIIGIDSSYSQTGHLFSEYRLRGALSGREGQAAIGVRDVWNIAAGVRVSGGFERTKSMNSSLVGNGANSNDTTALTGGLEYTRSENFKGTSRLELRRAATSDSVLGTLGAAARLNREVTVLARGIFNFQRGRDEAANAAQHRFQLGVSYRDRDDDRWVALGKYEFRQTKNGTAQGAFLPSQGGFTGDVGGTVHLFSGDVNFQQNAHLRLSGHYSAKLNADKSNGFSSQTWAQLLSARAIYDLNRKTEVSAQGAVLKTKGSGVQTGWGAELGRMMGRDLWLSAGYNASALSDGDLNGSGYSRRGPYLRIRFKFDESLFNGREALLLAAEKAPENRVVDVPVVGIDPQTQAKVELPLTAQVEVAPGASAPASVEIDAPQSASEAATSVPLNPRIVEGSGRVWTFKLDNQAAEKARNDFYARQYQARQVAQTAQATKTLTRTNPIPASKPVARAASARILRVPVPRVAHPARPVLRRAPTRKAARTKKVMTRTRTPMKKVVPRRDGWSK
ncbi:MAG TPA: hypothetical protein VF627_10255, partial [Abditibacterium sp.]